jgi:hypothetical protein
MYYGSRQEGHDIAQICLNGHEINSMTQKNPQFNKTFCTDCGQQTITACMSCHTPIIGYCYDVPTFSYYVPRHCHQCGKPFPWTEQKQAAALELFAEVLDMKAEEQREELKRDLDAIATDQPRTKVAAMRLQRMLIKAGQGALGMVRDMVVDIGSEIAVKTMYPGK